MGVLDPLGRKASAMQEFKEEYFEMLEFTMDSLDSYGHAIVFDRQDLLEEEDPFLFLPWREDPMDIDSIEELEEEKLAVEMMKEDISIDAMKNKYAEAFVNRKDVEPDYSDPLESYRKLDELSQSLDGLIDRINSKMVERFDLEPELVETEHDWFEYRLLETFFTLSEKINALPLIEGIVESEKNIEREKENLLAKAVNEHREHKESLNPDYDRVGLPTEPVRWKDVIYEDNLRDYLDITDIEGVTYGDTLHMMMEQICEEIDGLKPEYPLHFTNKGERNDTPNGNRIDNTVRPDAVDDLFVYEFKHMPREQRMNLESEGDLTRDEKFYDNVEQLNGYLNDLDLPAGILVYVSSDMNIKEYVVEQHDKRLEADLEEFIHEREEYDFESLSSLL